MRLAQERTLCAFDFDGTLAPITEHPDEANMSERTRHLLGEIAATYPCVILSGRARADVLSKLNGVCVEQVVGNHGAEAKGIAPGMRHHVEKWKAALDLEVGSIPGLWIEDKGLSLAVHYRQSPRKADVRRRVLAAVRNLDDVRVFGGKQVVNLVVIGAPHKGQALAAERDRLKCNWVLFAGDDENDEDAFALAGDTIAVRVGRKRRSHAGYFLRSQAEIDTLLELLISLRSPGRHPAAKHSCDESNTQTVGSPTV